MPAFEYYAHTLLNDGILHSNGVFKAAQLFNPKFVQVSRPKAADVGKIILTKPKVW